METPWDWISVIVFGALITLFLHRSSQPEPSDKLWQYGPPALACAVANYLGNTGYAIAAAAVLAAAGAYVIHVLKPKIGS